MISGIGIATREVYNELMDAVKKYAIMHAEWLILAEKKKWNVIYEEYQAVILLL